MEEWNIFMEHKMSVAVFILGVRFRCVGCSVGLRRQ